MDPAQIPALIIAVGSGMGCYWKQIEKPVQLPDVLDLHLLTRLGGERNVEAVVHGPPISGQRVDVPLRKPLGCCWPEVPENRDLSPRHRSRLVSPKKADTWLVIPLQD